jgi:hypothetical protein
MKLIESLAEIVRLFVTLSAQISELTKERDELRFWAGDGPKNIQPGHFYSPIPSLKEIEEYDDRIFSTRTPLTIPGIDLNEEEQLSLLNLFKDYYADIPFPETKTAGLRYFF